MVRIVRMDQDASLRSLLHAVLAEEGYCVVEAHNGYEGMPRDAAEPPTAAPADIMYLVAF